MIQLFQQLASYFSSPSSATCTSGVVVCFLQQATDYLAIGVEALAGLIIAFAAIQATIRAILLFFRKPQSEFKSEEPKTEDIRLRLGRWLALALEFELGADILRTAVAPTWNDIAQLAAIATIRTALNYFLQQEIDRAAQRQGVAAAQKLNAAAASEPGRVSEREGNVNALR